MAARSRTQASSSDAARVFGARFDTSEEADTARAQLQAIGYESAEISYIRDPARCSFTFDGINSHVTKGAAAGAASGGAVGGGVSVAVGALGLANIVLLGPVGLIAGVAAGGVVGALLSVGLNSDGATACENAVKAGSLVLTIQAHPGDEVRVHDILGDHVIAGEDIV